MKNFTLIFVFIFALFFSACAKDDEILSDSDIQTGTDNETSDTSSDGTSENPDENSDEEKSDTNGNDELCSDPQGDQDGDGVPNGIECPDFPCVDSDGDGIVDCIDSDSDADTISDSTECPQQPCVDTDEDGVPDMLDRDSDNDGMRDKKEVEENTDPTKKDTDGDGSDDLAEVVYGSDPLDPEDTIPAGIFYVVLPYLSTNDVERELSFSTNIEAIDVMFVIDASGSMFEEIDQVRDNIKTKIIDAIKDEFPGDEFAAFGLSRITFGNTGFFMRQPMTLDENKFKTALDNFGEREGGFAQGIAEIHTFPLYYNANPEGFTGTAILTGIGTQAPINLLPADCSNELGSIGHACFRKKSMPIYIYITDAEHSDCADAPNCSWDSNLAIGPVFMDAMQMMGAIGVKTIGINTWHELQGDGKPADGASPIEDMKLMAQMTGSLDKNGDPFIYQTVDNEGNGMPDQVGQAILDLTTFIDMDVTTGKMSDEECMGTNAAEFIKSSTTVKAVPTDGVSGQDATTFFSVEQGTEVFFNVKFGNDFCANETEQPLTFKAQVTVLGNGSYLSSRLVTVIVPVGDNK